MMTIDFRGPYSWTKTAGIASIFEDASASGTGVYFWTITQNDGELIYYVGETGRQFPERMAEHLKEHLSGFYHLNDPEQMAKGQLSMIWPGRYDTSQKWNPIEHINQFPQLIPLIMELVKCYRFYLSSNIEDDRMRKRIEAAIARHLLSQKGRVGNFHEKGIRYTARVANEPVERIKIQSKAVFIGLPKELDA